MPAKVGRTSRELLVAPAIVLGACVAPAVIPDVKAWLSYPSASASSLSRQSMPSATLDMKLKAEKAPEASDSVGVPLGSTFAAAGAAAMLVAANRRLARQPTGRRGVAVTAVAAEATTATPPASSGAKAEFDVAIVGSGPAGTLLAKLLADKHGASVCVIDPRADSPWPNNYGVWQEEWDSLEANLQVGLDKCLGFQWDFTDCYFGGSWDMPDEARMRLDRKYARVDRTTLKAQLQSSGVTVIKEAVDAQVLSNNIYSGGGIMHDSSGSTVTLKSGKTLRTKLIVDATGFESRLTMRKSAPGESPAPLPGFQIAYGFECIVDGNTHYATDAMTLFDYRTDHLKFDPAWEKKAEQAPTFMYAMPLTEEEGGGRRIFFEETSLVARPGVSFEDCRRRCVARLQHLGVKVREGTICDEEYCYIPMGGPLPAHGQRVVAFGAAATMVHPSTGYQLCRMMAGAGSLAACLARSLKAPGAWNPDAAAAGAYESLWSPDNQAQRDFAVFGGEFLMGLDVEGLRGWFSGFFQLDEPLWSGFLAGWPSLPGNHLHESWFARLTFGVQLLFKIPLPVAAKLAAGIATYSLTYGISLVRSVTPLFGSPPAYTFEAPPHPDEMGDPEAKTEARKMMAAGPHPFKL
eukprot:TRINITY_DN91824_c0_g1_i1.p1 TRINITY_DN91824_c0_g1~~TRINITY_DN91824_c0_g1_i1.p1  ORF type:complete len:633 (-),score=119.20 TRINITY_DN91824_c0_g1_i1:18-1916(-)